MMPHFMELFVVLVILVIVFGAKGLPRIGEAIGRMLAKRAGKGSAEDKR